MASSEVAFEEKSRAGQGASALRFHLVYDQILSVPDSNFLEDLDLNEAALDYCGVVVDHKPNRSRREIGHL